METGMLSKRAGKSKTGFQVSLFSASENDFLINFPGEDRGKCYFVNMCIYSTPSISIPGSASREKLR
jgi:hypothetical protein